MFFSLDNVDVQHSRMSQPRDDGDTALLNLSPTDADIDDDSTGISFLYGEYISRTCNGDLKCFI